MKDFSHIVSQQIVNDSAVFQVELNPTSEIYRGHFPSQPIVPGACSIEMIRECASAALGREIRFRSIRLCKFIQLLTPDTHTQLTVQLHWQDDSLAAEVFASETTAIRFKATIE